MFKWFKKLWKKRKLLVIITFLILIILLSAFGTKTWLYLNFLLGNDIVIKLTVDKESLFILKEEQEKIEFEMKVKTNPFCTATCKSYFIDISQNDILEKDEFILRPTIPLKKEYNIKATRFGKGQDLYRFDIDCHGRKTLLCHTKEEPTTRSLLITVDYDLNSNDRILKNNAKEDLTQISKNFTELEIKNKELKNAIESLKNTFTSNYFFDQYEIFKENLNLVRKRVLSLSHLWENQDYLSLNDWIKQTEKEIIETKIIAETLENEITKQVDEYNNLINDIVGSKSKLEELQQIESQDPSFTKEINNSINKFNKIINDFKTQKQVIENKELITTIINEIEVLYLTKKQELKENSLLNQIKIGIEYDSFCEITGRCIEHPTIEEYAKQEIFNIENDCLQIKTLSLLFSKSKDSSYNEYLMESYPATETFENDISAKVHNTKQNIISNYLTKLPENEKNTAIIKKLLVKKPIIPSNDYPNYNLTPAMVVELNNQKPILCKLSNKTFNKIEDISFDQITINKTQPEKIDIEFEEPLPRCCAFGKCEPCCTTEKCKNDPKTFPVVFLHGHAVSKDTSAEYSLEGFNKIQKKLEESGYLNAGAITLYTSGDVPLGNWGLTKSPLTIRASYYFDMFKEPENYVAIQTKSENIDTYSIRLKEIIDIIKYRTGKPKINIVAFSMGGLVARRYVQIFGTENVNKLILIGTPNKGIVGEVADFCPLIGEKLECRDMNENSLFMKKLNSGTPPNIPTYTIVGTGCDMGIGQGDGTVLKEKSMLEWAENNIVEGKCRSKFEPLHLDLRDTDMYPEVYDSLLKILEE